MAHLNDIQSGSASSREFALTFRLDDKTANDPIQLSQIAKRIHGFGFQVRLAQEQDIKRILAVYYQQDVVTDHFPNFDGEQEVEQHISFLKDFFRSYKDFQDRHIDTIELMLTQQMGQGVCDQPSIAAKMAELSKALETVTGRKVYGYLPKPIKAQVDTIVDELSQIPEVAECYEVWNGLKDELDGYYKENPRQHLPLSQQKEFRAIKNMVIQEALDLQLREFSFEDEGIKDEPEPEYERQEPDPDKPQSVFQMAEEYRNAKAVLSDEAQPFEHKEKAVSILERLWDEGFTVAAHQLGKVWRDGLCGSPDMEKAEEWFLRSAEAENDYSQYALGKLLQDQGRTQEALEWYEKADEQGNQYARYRLGKLYLLGEDVPKDVPAALIYLEAAATQGNQFAQYTLGKLYLLGQDMARDREQARKWLTLSAEQGNEYAQFFLDRFDQFHDPSTLLCVTRLLHHMSRIFRQTPLPANPQGVRIDSKRRKALLEKRLAMGHKIDDHEDSKMHQIREGPA